MKDEQKNTLLQNYNKQLYLSFSLLVRGLFEDFLNSHNFKFQIFHRAKDIERLSEKIDRKAHDGKDYKNLSDIEDLAGVRIVFYLETDKKKFLKLFFDNFSNCILSHKEKLSPNGYRGFHIIFTLDDDRSVLSEYQKYEGLKCEIQVSSILFHAWSEVEHDIIYKPHGDPKLLQTLGLNELAISFDKVMTEHLQSATIQLDYINKKYEEIRSAGQLLASDFIRDIMNAETNDEIYKTLEIIGKFCFRKPDETLAIIQTILKRNPLNPVILYHFQDHDIYGKGYRDLILKCIELILSIRYYKPDEVLDLLSFLILNDDINIQEKALEVVKKFAQYNFNILTNKKIGYGAQRKALDFILAWNTEEQLHNINFVEVILKELLNSSVEGTTTGLNENADYTLTVHFAVVSPTDFLKNMRREVMDLIYKLYKATEDPKLKLKLVEILGETAQTPSNVAYGDDVTRMIVEDIKYLNVIYRKIIFGEEESVMTDLLGIVAVIEERLYWINRSDTKKVKGSEDLYQDIFRDEMYKLFRLLVGDPITYRAAEDIDFSEKTRLQEIDQLISIISKEKIVEWFNKFSKIAGQHIIVDDWKFNTFKEFLRKLSEVKPEIADEILNKVFEDNSPLKYFTGSILDGFRTGLNFDIWSKYVNRIIDDKNFSLITAVVFSLNINLDVDLKKFIREEDVNLLEDITKQSGKFIFLNKADERVLHFALFGTLLRIFKVSPERIGRMIIEEIKNNSKYLNKFFSELTTAFYRKHIEIKNLPQDILKFLKESIIELPDLDWHVQEILLQIGQREGLGSVLEVFMGRINKDAKSKKGKQRVLNEERYESIPYHFNPGLVKFITEDAEYKRIASEWLMNMTKGWSIYNWHVSHFLRRLGHGFDDVIRVLIEKGDENSLIKAAEAMHSLDDANFELCIEIVRKTNNKKILGIVEGDMYSTGVVSGEYGIAKAFESKAKDLEQYKDDTSANVRIFVNTMIDNFKTSALKERERADEKKQLRKIEFEG